MPKSNSIQFIGTQRSGSNLLRLILNQHHEISAPHPPHILHNFVNLVPYYGDLSTVGDRKNLVNDIITWIKLNPVSWGDLTFDANRIVEQSSNIYDIFSGIYAQKAAYDKARIWCCKSTFNIHHAAKLEQHIRPFYIYLYRDGRDVAASFMKTIVGDKHAYFLATQWKKEQELSQELLKHLAPDRYIRIKYEELLLSPKEISEEICSSLGIAYESDMMEYYKSDESWKTAHSGRMWENVDKPIIKNNIDKYKHELKKWEIEIFEEIAGETLSNLNYPIFSKNNGISKTWKLEEFTQVNNLRKKRLLETATKNEVVNREKQLIFLSSLKRQLKN